MASLSTVQGTVWDGAGDTGTGTGTNWNTGGNWDTTTVPGVGEDADLQMTGADYTINYDAPMAADSIGRLQIDNEEGYTTTLNINAADFVSSTGGTNLGLGPQGAIVVGTNGVASFNSTWDSGSAHNLYGDITVDGGSLELTAHYIRASQDATITLESGALTIAVPDSANRVIDIGAATININGGEAELGIFLRLGRYDHGNGTLNMTDGTLNLERTQLGWNNTYGTANISGGEVKSTGVLQVGNYNYASGGAALNLSGGTWEQTNGSLVSVAKDRGGASLNVTGTGIFNTTGDTILGEESGTSDYTPNGTLLIDGGSYIATNETGDATITVQNGTLFIGRHAGADNFLFVAGNVSARSDSEHLSAWVNTGAPGPEGSDVRGVLHFDPNEAW